MTSRKYLENTGGENIENGFLTCMFANSSRESEKKTDKNALSSQLCGFLKSGHFWDVIIPFDENALIELSLVISSLFVVTK